MSIPSLPKQTPTTPGIYTFKRWKKPLYIGKAENLRKRLASYFRKNASEKVRALRAEATQLEWQELNSDIEALITEAELIKKYRPKYNVLMRDDKNYFYVGITKEDFPRIFITHQPYEKIQNSKFKIQNSIRYIGPFTSGSALKTALRLLQNVFPHCTCKEKHKRPCLNAEIGRCPGYCCLRPDLSYSNVLKNIGIDTGMRADDLNKKHRDEYERNIQNITAVLSGKKKKILGGLKKEMKKASRDEDFEKAAGIRDQVRGLENIFAHAVLHKNREVRRPFSWPKIQKNLKTIFGINIRRAEGYDISNISGTEATGSMVVFMDGRPAKSEYRKFKIKTVTGANDVAMLAEVIRRRLAHQEWQFPDLMLIDGGRAQLNAVRSVVTSNQLPITRIAALAKREEELYMEGRSNPLPLASLPPDTAFFFQNVRNESHRFAKKYHHKRREMALCS